MKKTNYLYSRSLIVPMAIFLLSAGTGSISPSQSNSLDSLGNAQSNHELSNNLIAEVHQSERDGSESFLSVTWSIENKGDTQATLTWLRDGSYAYSGQNFAGVTVLSKEKETRYRPIMDGKGSCLCSGEESNELVNVLNPGEKIAYWSLFSVPEDVETVTVEIPNFDPIEDIPIS